MQSHITSIPIRNFIGVVLCLCVASFVSVDRSSAQETITKQRSLTVQKPQTRTLKRVPVKRVLIKKKVASQSRSKSKAASKKERRKQRAIRASNKHLESLEPPFRAKVKRVLETLRAQGWEPVIISGRRDAEQQRKIVAAGRSGTMKSYHLCGRAADIADRRYGWRGEARSPKFPFWDALGKAARDEGLVWGGDWKRRDIPHIQSKKRCP